MDKEKWIEKQEQISEWLNNNDIGAMGTVIRVNLEAGDSATTDEDRDRFWEAIRALCKTLPNSPIQKGRGSTLPIEVQTVLDTLSDEVAQAASDFFAIGNLSNLLQKHGKSGGGLFIEDEYPKYMVQSIMSHMRRRYKDGIWDGTLEGLNSQTFPQPEVVEEV